MTPADSVQMHSYELPLAADRVPPPETTTGETGIALSEPLLIKNVVLFCRLRWIVVGTFAAFGILSLFPDLFRVVSFRPYVKWPFAIAGILALTNLAYLWHARRLAGPETPQCAKGNLWAQIILDLLILTVVIHFAGSLETYVPFTYLFHIVLACIFLPRSQSLAVTMIASGLYVGCVGVEVTGIIPSVGIYAGTGLRELIGLTRGVSAVYVMSALGVWVVVWHLTSHLSTMVRQGSYELAETNRRLLKVQEEKMKHMLRTTHELKAPFAAIHANAQLLLCGHCGKLSEAALNVASRIARRCRKLTKEIQEMLQLANLSSQSEEPLQWTELDLGSVLNWCIEDVQKVAEEYGIAIDDNDLHPAPTMGVEDHLKILFSNLLSNAVLYSRRGGTVHIRCGDLPADGIVVIIEDHGIGIPEDKLSRIFDEYYRTDEAARHNEVSTGLGLAIVRQIAEMHGIFIRVESNLGNGTKFTLRFGGERVTRQENIEIKQEANHGISNGG